MNYCPNCGTKVESFWKVCANCGYRLSKEISSPIIEKKPANQEFKVVPPKESYTYFKPQKTYGTYALTFGIIGFGLSILTLVIRIIPIVTFNNVSIVVNNVFIIAMGVTAAIFGFIGIFKDDSKGMTIAGFILGLGVFAILFIRAQLYIYSIFTIPIPPP
ncbi:MAG: zinc ribbon domain-containing protein [Candidatus Heimdallarchaeota archaeon]